MILDYVALALLILGATLAFYTFIYIHDLPHALAKKRGHPHAEAIGVACWLSLLTLHAIWPIVFIWAMTKQSEDSSATFSAAQLDSRIDGLAERLGSMESRLESLQTPRVEE